MKKSIVIIAHGLFMNKIVMKPMEKNFKEKGFDTLNFGYNTLKYDELTLEKFHKEIEKLKEYENIYFVGHSMGGLLIKDYLSRYKLPSNIKDTALVTLGTPHNGSIIAKTIDDSALKLIFGKATNAGLLSGSKKIDNKVPIGSVAGNLPYGVNLIMQVFHNVHEPSDGTVFVKEAIDPQSKDFLIKARTHMTLIYCSQTVDDCIYFFKHKKFLKTPINEISKIKKII